MDQPQLQTFMFSCLIITISLLLFKWLNNKPTGSRNLPPSPPRLPILGNLHHFKHGLSHRSLESLARKHGGPLTLLHLGRVHVLVVSSANAAREILRTHDLSFVNRPILKAAKKLLYNGKNVSTAPYGEYWRQVRSIFVLQLLSNKRVQSFRSIREEETQLFMKRIQESSCGPLNLTKMFSEFAYDGICRSAFGRKYGESESGKKFMILLSECMELLGTIGIAGTVPWLSWITRFNGFDKRVDEIFQGLDGFLEGLIQEHMMEITNENDDVFPKDKSEENFLDILLQYQKENTSGDSIDRDSIKGLILDVFVAGTDTISTVLEWVLTELLRHPIVMEKLQNEVMEIAKDREGITDLDLEKMHYMKAVIKETLRYHPPIAILVPRIAGEDLKVNGYDVKAGTIVMINVYAIGRDTASWDEPEKFMPERFLNRSVVDFKGLDFELILFGSGRRGCPGITFGVATMEILLANLMHKYNWELPDGKVMDMTEAAGVTVRRVVPLLAVATPRK
ncbi:hypothetical protein OROMI_007832 [Orobanche minor]